MSGMSARARVTSARSSVRDDERLVPQRPAHAQIALRTGDHRTAGELLATFAAHEVRQRDVQAVLVGHVAREPLPPRHARRTRHAVLYEATLRAPAAPWAR